MEGNLPKGYTCTCGKFNEYPAYVYAHWYIELIHTCECGKKWIIIAGDVEEMEADDEMS